MALTVAGVAVGLCIGAFATLLAVQLLSPGVLLPAPPQHVWHNPTNSRLTEVQNCTSSATPLAQKWSDGWGGQCIELEKVCIDQQIFVTFDPHYQPDLHNNDLPRFSIENMVFNWPNKAGNGDVFQKGSSHHFNPFVLRISNSMESQADLQNPVFSNCTVPIFLYTRYPFNMGETFTGPITVLHMLYLEGLLDPNQLPVYVTPHGVQMPHYTRIFLEALFKHKVVTLADLSARYRRGGPAGHLPRCFERASVCKFQDVHHQGIYAAARHVVDHYATSKTGGLPVRPMWPNEEEAIRDEAENGTTLLRVVIAQRVNKTGRLILNEGELLEACNGDAGRGGQADLAAALARARETLKKRELVQTANSTETGPVVKNNTEVVAHLQQLLDRLDAPRPLCMSRPFGVDVLEDLAVMQDADVLICVHGAACNNAFFMRQGAALVEIRPYRFSKDWANHYFSSQIMGDGNKIMWWGLEIKDKRNSKDSYLSKKDVFQGWTGDREHHVRPPWEAVAQHLALISLVQRTDDYADTYAKVFGTDMEFITDSLIPQVYTQKNPP